jgi:hypothetical protein
MHPQAHPLPRAVRHGHGPRGVEAPPVVLVREEVGVEASEVLLKPRAIGRKGQVVLVLVLVLVAVAVAVAELGLGRVLGVADVELVGPPHRLEAGVGGARLELHLAELTHALAGDGGGLRVLPPLPTPTRQVRVLVRVRVLVVRREEERRRRGLRQGGRRALAVAVAVERQRPRTGKRGVRTAMPMPMPPPRRQGRRQRLHPDPARPR